MDILQDSESADAPPVYLQRVGEIFASFGAHSHDSGNLSYGVSTGGERFFVKTPGAPSDPAFLSHSERVAALRNAVELARSCSH